MSDLTTIKENIQNWNLNRNGKNAIKFLNSGNGFLISENDFKNWSEIKPTPNNINCYLAINKNNDFVIYLVDDITDSSGNYTVGVNLFEKRFEEYFDNLPGLSNSLLKSTLPPSEADSRITNWVLCSNAWICHKQSLRQEKESVEQGEMVQVFTIPFLDLKDLFINKKFENLKATFALKYYETKEVQGYDMEVILAKTDFNNDPEAGVSLVKESFADTSHPHPPYSLTPNKFNLLR
ncbi:MULTISPECIES: hypothetical protein [Mesonia]|uniref:Uncharacterized protein n=1 Tax=Mesonia oceanica TaxID=2687242 RepID=A0AC61Y4Z4_9FLAO|nr:MULTISPECIES: hypothetical protein [Mesonia]MAN27701.1 hypothetical protein [Mesonia sp.]MAQ39697.1 hypothetical protein [Mesonia sp.]VVU99541.1 hypothetical protein FVB9532_00796 [Mesonia oceanica]|tara:strand:+ start:2481 stop:3188 length:708 start_codon:yes stop_codon:yes gene_type:complete